MVAERCSAGLTSPAQTRHETPMQWYYSAHGKPQGPVSQADLETLARTGAVTPQTLVWREGMADWAAYSTITTPSPPPMPGTALPATTLPVAALARCVECGRTFPRDDMVTFENAHICAACKPLFFQKLHEGAPTRGEALWRDRKLLVTALNPVLPARCVKCNAPTEAPQKKQDVYWHPPLIYLALLINILIYLIVALIARKRSTVMVSLCEQHRVMRRNAILIVWLFVLVGIGTIIAGIAESSGWIGGGVLLLLGGIIYGIVKTRLVYATKIDKEHVWLGGCGPDFLAAFPEWTRR